MVNVNVGLRQIIFRYRILCDVAITHRSKFYSSHALMYFCRALVYFCHALMYFCRALTYFLSLCRNLVPAHNRVKAGNFVLSGLTGMELFNKTTAVIGTGAIGKCFAKIMLVRCYGTLRSCYLTWSTCFRLIYLDLYIRIFSSSAVFSRCLLLDFSIIVFVS